MIRLVDLSPQFMKIETPALFKHVATIEEADGIMFLCPKCFEKNGGAIGTHSVICWRPHVPQTIHPTPGRWNFLGQGYDDLTLQAGSSSILLSGPGCGAHFFIQNGEVQ